MRALVLRDHRADPRLEDFRTPEPGPGQRAVQVVAAGLNPVDVMQAGAADAAVPRVLGNEAVVRDGGALAYAERTVAPFGASSSRH